MNRNIAGLMSPNTYSISFLPRENNDISGGGVAKNNDGIEELADKYYL